MLSILKLNIEGSAKKPNAPRNRLLLIYDFGPNQADIQAILPNWSYEGLNFKALNFYLRSFGLRILRTHRENDIAFIENDCRSDLEKFHITLNFYFVVWT